MKEAQDLRGSRGMFYLIACGSSSATTVVEPCVRAAQAAGWEVCVITTPKGRNFLNMPLLAQMTGHPVRSDYKLPDTPDLLPRADAIVVFPATFNTLNKWALGISDTLAVGLLCEYLGLGMPIVAVPCVHVASGLDTHPAFFKSMELLTSWGVCLLHEPEIYPPMNEVPPEVILEKLHALIAERSREKG